MVRYCKRCKKENTNVGSKNCKKCDDRNDKANEDLLFKIDTSKKTEISLLGYRSMKCRWSAWKLETVSEDVF
jgi:hypothetical protein